MTEESKNTTPDNSKEDTQKLDTLNWKLSQKNNNGVPWYLAPQDIACDPWYGSSVDSSGNGEHKNKALSNIKSSRKEFLDPQNSKNQKPKQ